MEQFKSLITRTCQRGVASNKNVIEEGECLYKGLLLSPTEFQNYKRLSETVESWTFAGAMTVSDKDAEAMRLINQAGQIHVMLVINMDDDNLVQNIGDSGKFMKLDSRTNSQVNQQSHLLFYPTLMINNCQFDVKTKVWIF